MPLKYLIKALLTESGRINTGEGSYLRVVLIITGSADNPRIANSL